MRAGVIRAGLGIALALTAEAGLDAVLPKLPLCIWCGAVPDDGSSAAAGHPPSPCVRDDARALCMARTLAA